MNIARYLSQVRLAEENLVDALITVGDRHDRDVEVREISKLLASWSRWRLEQLEPFIEKYGEDKGNNEQAQRLMGALFHGTRLGGMGLLADLQDMLLLATQVDGLWTSVWQAAKGCRDRPLEVLADEACKSVDRQITWLKGYTKVVAPQAIIVPEDKSSEITGSIPHKQTPTTQQDLLWGPGVSGLLMLVVGALALAAGLITGLSSGLPWLFPSLGPTAYIQATDPASPPARFYNTVVGHGIGLVCGFMGAFVMNAYSDPVVQAAHQLTFGRVGAAAIALALTVGLTLALKASHPPAGATTLLVALGAFKLEDTLSVVAGVLIVAVAGEVFRRMRLGELTTRSERSEKRVPAPKAQA